MPSYRNLPIRQKIMVAIVGTTGAALLLASMVYTGYEWVSTREETVQNLYTVADIIASNSTAALSFSDAHAAEETLSALRAKPEVVLACIYTTMAGGGATPMAVYRTRDAKSPCPPRPARTGLVSTRSLIKLSVPVRLQEETIGILYLERSLDDLQTAVYFSLLVIAAVMLACIFVAVVMSALLQRIIAAPILSLADTADHVSKTRDYTIRASRGNSDEVGALIEGFNDMLGQIGERDQALLQARTSLEARLEEIARTNSELQKTLARLRETQEQLVMSEKMASLGGLVAGIAHEINTPVGVGVTAASTLHSGSLELKTEYDAGKLTDSGLKRYVSLATQSSEIILNNLHRASDLIHSFKQVAVDQSSSEKRIFAVKAYINEILLSLRPKLKKTRLQVVVNCDENLQMDSYPGSLAQILTNLVMNSLIHAYDEGQSGTITIDVSRKGNLVGLRYSDDGKGIPKENIPRVFDPFFTTRRGVGGSGLGMHIVFNLVTQQLGGTINLKSELGKGTVIEIAVPDHMEEANEQPKYATR